MRKKLLCLCAAVLLDLCFFGIVCRLAVGMQRGDLTEVEQADQTVFSPECFSGGELALTFDDGLQERVSMTPVFWDIDTLDWKSRNTARIVKHICKNAAVHTVVLMHDAYQTSVDAALETIDTLTAEGYTFVTIEECLID